MNCFSLFNLLPKYDLDINFLNRQYLSIQRKIYLKDPVAHEKEISQINFAYEVLKNPYRRAVHILKLNDWDIKAMDLKHKLSTEDLEYFLQCFEEVDNSSDRSFLLILLQKNQNAKNHLMEILSEKFSFQFFSEAIYFTVKLKYVMNLIEYIKNKIKNVS